MNILRKPFVACLIAFAIVALSTGYLFLIHEEEEINLVEIGNRHAEEEIEETNIDVMDGFVGEFKGVTFATLNDLHPVVSNDEEFFWLYGSIGDVSSLIMLQVIDVAPAGANEFALREIFGGMSLAPEVSNFNDIGTLDIQFLNKGVTFEQVIGDRNHIGVTYLLVISDYLVLNVSYIHYEGEHTDLRSDFDFLLEHIWLDADPYEIALNFSGMLQVIQNQDTGGSTEIYDDLDEDVSESDVGQEIELLALGDTFILDDLEITVGEDIGFTEVTRAASSRYGLPVFYLPITARNISSSASFLSTMSSVAFSPDGELGPCICPDFPETNIFRIREIQPGEAVEALLHILYSEDGEYILEFGDNLRSSRNPGEVKFRFVFDVTKE